MKILPKGNWSALRDLRYSKVKKYLDDNMIEDGQALAKLKAAKLTKLYIEWYSKTRQGVDWRWVMKMETPSLQTLSTHKIDIGINEDKRLEKGITGIARRKYE